MALDLILKSLIKSPEFTSLSDKNWDAVSNLVPGTTPRECSVRYQELLKEHSSSPLGDLSVIPPANKPSSSKASSKADTESTSDVKSRPNSGKNKGSKNDKDLASKKSKQVNGDADHGPTMVIHVCDEAKNLKQDFQCPRDLLVNEMKYFAEYLSLDAQRWEEVDISVHCDVQIFDWLMKYVKRFTKEVTDPPRLEPNNVISILISSDFLKMDSLVQECIEYCHQNMTAIVATPCNMNCINDKLVSRIADLFTHNEADDVKDRKDKFKSKLFAKKLEKLFEANTVNPCSPENASTLYRCSTCQRLLTKNLESKLKCLSSKISIDRQGNLSFYHTRDPTWDVNDYLLELKSQLKSWREVYWRVWGAINYLKCSRCQDYFPGSELGHCKYHPEKALFEEKSTEKPVLSAIGTYSCCAQKTLRFDPLGLAKGCKLRDHIVIESPGKSSDKKSSGDTKNTVYDDLLAHRDLVCVAPQSQQQLMAAPSISSADVDGSVDELDEFDIEEEDLHVFAKEESACGLRPGSGVKDEKFGSSKILSEGSKQDLWQQPKLQALTVSQDTSFEPDDIGVMGESDDEIGDEETGKVSRSRSRVTVDPHAILVDAPDFATTKNRKWDGTRSLRWNQDSQREEDQRRMREMISYLTRLRLNPEKIDKMKQKEYNGGMFAKLEAQWKSSNISQAKTNAAQLSRQKTRPFQITNRSSTS